MKIQNVNIPGNVNKTGSDITKNDSLKKTKLNEDEQKIEPFSNENRFIQPDVFLEEGLIPFFEKLAMDAQIIKLNSGNAVQLSFNNIEWFQSNDFNNRIKNFTLNFPMPQKVQNSAAPKANIEKEDILFFVKKIIDKVIKIASDKNKRLDKIILEQEDLDEILGYRDEKGNLVLYELIQMVLELARSRNLQKKAEKSKLYDLIPERGKKNILEEQTNNSNNKSWLKVEISNNQNTSQQNS